MRPEAYIETSEMNALRDMLADADVIDSWLNQSAPASVCRLLSHVLSHDSCWILQETKLGMEAKQDFLDWARGDMLSSPVKDWMESA